MPPPFVCSAMFIMGGCIDITTSGEGVSSNVSGEVFGGPYSYPFTPGDQRPTVSSSLGACLLSCYSSYYNANDTLVQIPALSLISLCDSISPEVICKIQ